MKLCSSDNHYTTPPSRLEDYIIHVRDYFISLNEVLMKMVINIFNGVSTLLVTWQIPLYVAVGVLESLNIFLTLVANNVLKQTLERLIAKKKLS